MNIEKLELTTYKNYKSLCEVLNEPFKKSGHSRDSQLKEWSRYFMFVKQGHKITVTEVYDTVKSKVDGRVNNGQHENSKQALDDNRSHRPRVIPLDLLYNMISCYHLIKLAIKHNTTIFKLVTNYTDTNTCLQVKPQDLFLELGIYNNFTSRLMLNKIDLLYNENSPFVETDEEAVYMVLNNLYNSIKDKLLCEYVKQLKVIVGEDYKIRIPLDDELELIAEVEQDLINRYNSKYNKSLEKYGDVYNLPSDVRNSIQQRKYYILGCQLDNYKYDCTLLVINKSIQSDIQQLGLTVDNTLDTQVEELFQQLKQQIHDLYYNNEVDRVNNNYDKQIQVINNSQRAKGNYKKVKSKQVENNRSNSLLLLRYCLASDLTGDEVKQIGKLLDIEELK